MNYTFICRQLCILYQHKDIEQIEKRLNKEFENLCGWFFDSKLSIHFDKAKSIFFVIKQRAKNICQLNFEYKDINIRQHLEVTYLGGVLHETMAGDSMVLKLSIK